MNDFVNGYEDMPKKKYEAEKIHVAAQHIIQIIFTSDGLTFFRSDCCFIPRFENIVRKIKFL